MNFEHPPAMQSTQGQNNNCSTNINVISATENLHKGIAGRSNLQRRMFSWPEMEGLIIIIKSVGGEIKGMGVRDIQK